MVASFGPYSSTVLCRGRAPEEASKTLVLTIKSQTWPDVLTIIAVHWHFYEILQKLLFSTIVSMSGPLARHTD